MTENTQVEYVRQDPTTSKAVAKQATQVIELFEFFAEKRSPATLAEVATTFGWPKSSASNLLAALRSRGYLYEPNSKRGFFPTPKLAELTDRIRGAEPAPEAVGPLLDALVRETGETAALAAPNGLMAVIMAIRESPSAVRFTSTIGESFPMSNSTPGRALLSLLDASERERFYQRVHFQKFTANTLTSPSEIEADIQTSQKRGWFIGNQELQIGLMGVAVPVKTTDRHYAVLIAGPAERMSSNHHGIAAVLKKLVAKHLGRL